LGISFCVILSCSIVLMNSL